jgi:beta-carotene hydroxylase
MSENISSSDFKKMVQGPQIAWPTVILFVGCFFGLFYVSWLAMEASIPFWLASIGNGILIYFLFSVVHDAMHRSISKISWFNDSLGHIGIFFFAPVAPFNLGRRIHMKHHRFTNDSQRDPDHFGHKLDWLTPLRWLNIDYYYTLYLLQQETPEIQKRHTPRIILQAILIVSLILIAAYFGYLFEVIMLFIIPTRISSFLTLAMFVYLPHVPFSQTSMEDEYQASSIRSGWEWLLTPLMAYQNYHLTHHLYPRAPFYRMLMLWNARLDEHLANDPYFVKTFGVGKKG